MTPQGSVAEVVLHAEREYQKKVLSALYNYAGSGATVSGRQYMSPDDAEPFFANGETCFEHIDGRHIGVSFKDGTLNAAGYIKVHGMRTFMDAMAAASGRPNTRV